MLAFALIVCAVLDHVYGIVAVCLVVDPFCHEKEGTEARNTYVAWAVLYLDRLYETVLVVLVFVKWPLQILIVYF